MWALRIAVVGMFRTMFLKPLIVIQTIIGTARRILL